MKKTRTRENDAVFFMLLGLTAVFFCWRCRSSSRTLRRCHSLGAAAGALALAVYAPYGINALSYNSLGILLMAMTGALLVPAEEESRAAYILAGLSFAGSVLCCPYLIAVYLLYALFVFIPRKKKKLPAFYPRPFGLFTLGAAGLAIVFFLIVGADALVNLIL